MLLTEGHLGPLHYAPFFIPCGKDSSFLAAHPRSMQMVQSSLPGSTLPSRVRSDVKEDCHRLLSGSFVIVSPAGSGFRIPATLGEAGWQRARCHCNHSYLRFCCARPSKNAAWHIYGSTELSGLVLGVSSVSIISFPPSLHSSDNVAGESPGGQAPCKRGHFQRVLLLAGLPR